MKKCASAIVTMDKYLFLDFDGVLNTEFYQDLLMSQGKPYRDKHGPFFDPMAVKQLKRVVDSTHADIVIESSWKYLGLEAMQDMWTVTLHRRLSVPAGHQILTFSALMQGKVKELG